jgi:glycerol-1-phosphate dehydrogenase [NAD(P)+]
MIAPKPALHGEQCGVGAIMSAYLQKANWQRLREVLRKIGAPINSSELGIDARYIIEALTMVQRVRPERYTVFGREGLSVHQAETLARRTKVIC